MLRSFEDETCGRTDRHVLPNMRLFYALYEKGAIKGHESPRTNFFHISA